MKIQFSKMNIENNLIFSVLIYMLIATVSYSFGLNLHLFSYDITVFIPLLLIPVLLFGLINKHCDVYTSFLKIGVVFGLYILVRCSVFYLFGISSTVSFPNMVSVSLSWVIFMMLPCLMKYKPENFTYTISLTLIGICFVAATYYNNISGISYTNQYRAMAVNSIYYLLALFPVLVLCRKRILRIILIAIVVATVIYSNKATTFVALVFSLLIVVLHSESGKKIKIGTLIIIIAIPVIIWIFNDSLSSIGAIQKIGSINDAGTAADRFVIYRSILEKFSASSALNKVFGHGYNGLGRYLNRSSHNDFLGILFEYGLIGAVLYLCFIVALVKEMLRALKKPRRIDLAFAVSVCIYLISALTSEMLFIPRYFPIIAYLWGLYYKLTYCQETNVLESEYQ